MPPVRVERYRTAGGADPVSDFLNAIPVLHRAAYEEVIQFLKTGEIDNRPRHRAYVGDGIWELRVSFGKEQYRILYTVAQGAAVLLDGFHQKTQQAPKRRLNLAMARQREL